MKKVRATFVFLVFIAISLLTGFSAAGANAGGLISVPMAVALALGLALGVAAASLLPLPTNTDRSDIQLQTRGPELRELVDTIKRQVEELNQPLLSVVRGELHPGVADLRQQTGRLEKALSALVVMTSHLSPELPEHYQKAVESLHKSATEIEQLHASLSEVFNRAAQAAENLRTFPEQIRRETVDRLDTLVSQFRASRGKQPLENWEATRIEGLLREIRNLELAFSEFTRAFKDGAGSGLDTLVRDIRQLNEQLTKTRATFVNTGDN